MPAAQIIDQVQARQDVQIVRPLGDGNRRDRRAGLGAVDHDAGRFLVLDDGLHADIAAPATTHEVQLHEGRGDLFFDIPVLVEIVGVEDRRAIVVHVKRAAQIDGQDIAETGPVQRHRRFQILSVNIDLLPAILQEQVIIIDPLGLLALGVVYAGREGVEEALHVALDLQIGGLDGLLDVGEANGAVVAPAAPRRPVTQRHLRGVRIVQTFGIGRIAVVVHREVNDVQGAADVRRRWRHAARPPSIAGVGFQNGLAATIVRIGQVGDEAGPVVQLVLGVEADRENLVFAGVAVVADDGNGVVDRAAAAERRAAAILGHDPRKIGVVSPGVRKPLRAPRGLLLLEFRIVEIEDRMDPLVRTPFDNADDRVALIQA